MKNQGDTPLNSDQYFDQFTRCTLKILFLYQLEMKIKGLPFLVKAKNFKIFKSVPP